LSNKGWVYLDNKVNATKSGLDNNLRGGLLKLSEAGLKREERHLGSTKEGRENGFLNEDLKTGKVST
jgi:hypothetical protein